MDNLLKSKYLLSIICFVFLILLTMIVQKYITQKENEISKEKYSNISFLIQEKIDLLIKKEKNSILSLSLSISNGNQKIKDVILKNGSLDLKNIVKKLDTHTNLKHLWFQIIDKNGNSVYRTWSSKRNDNLLNVRKDLKELIKKPKIKSSISVGRYDITFKATIPLYQNGEFIGFFETISHFDNVVRFIESSDDVHSLIIVDKEHSKQLRNNSFSKTFVQNHYIPSYLSNKDILSLVRKENISDFISIDKYILKNEYLVINYKIKDKNTKLGNFLVFKKLDSIDMTDLEDFKRHAFFYIFTFILLILLMIFTIFYYFYARKLKSVHIKLSRNKRKLQELNENLQITIEHEVKKNEQKNKLLFQQNKMAAMGEMIENIAHQWRQPLSLITTEASALKVKKEYGLLENNDIENSLESIIETSNYLSHTIDDFRNYFSPNKEKNFFNSNKLIQKCLNLISREFNNRNIKIILDIENIEINSYENELVQVIINILNNAKDELIKIEDREKRFIFINLFIQEDSICIKIKDSAGGIDEEIIDRIFEPYFTTKHKSKGTGIGLYMVDQILEKHIKGYVKVKNERYNYENCDYTGAVFSLIIPKN